jgi:hypothetical protein
MPVTWPGAPADANPSEALAGLNNSTRGCRPAVIGVTMTEIVWFGSMFKVNESTSPAKPMIPSTLRSYTSEAKGAFAASGTGKATVPLSSM